MRKVWIIASREYRATIRTKAFLIALVLMPVLMGGGIFVQTAMEGRVDTADKRIAVVDLSGKMFTALFEAVEQRNQNEITDGESKRQTESRYVLEEEPVSGADLDHHLLELSDRVRQGKLFAFIVIPADVLDASGPTAEKVRYYSNQPTYDQIRRWLGRHLNDRVVSVRLENAQIDRALVQQALRPVAVENLGLMEREAGGDIRQGKEMNDALTFGLPFGLLMLMFMSISITAGPLLNGVLEEKMQRIAEVLLGSVPPFELMMGKLIGSVGISVTLVGIYLGGGFAALSHYGYADAISWSLLGWFVVYQAITIFMFGSMFLALGACCNDVKEAQNLLLPVWLLMCVPLFAMSVVVQHPNSLFSVLLSLFPPATPMLMILRMAIPPGMPLWQPLLGIVGTLLTTVLCVWVAGRIFRVALLLQGKPPKIGEILRWVARG